MRPRRPCGGGPEEAPTAPTASLRSAQHKAWCGPSQGGEEGLSQGGSSAGLAAPERRQGGGSQVATRESGTGRLEGGGDREEGPAAWRRPRGGWEPGGLEGGGGVVSGDCLTGACDRVSLP